LISKFLNSIHESGIGVFCSIIHFKTMPSKEFIATLMFWKSFKSPKRCSMRNSHSLISQGLLPSKIGGFEVTTVVFESEES
jgi:hypothetical protein